MSVFAYDRLGRCVPRPAEAELRALLDGLDAHDPEHPDVSLNDEAGWSLSVFASGRVVLENVETDEGPWHLQLSTPADAMPLWRALAAGCIEDLRAEAWHPGYGA